MIADLVAPDGTLAPAAGAHRGFYRPHGGFPFWKPADDPQEVLDEALSWAARANRPTTGPRPAPPADRPTAPRTGSRRADGRSRDALRRPDRACRRRRPGRRSCRSARARPRPAGCPVRARSGRPARGHRVAPEQRDHERRAAVAAGRRCRSGRRLRSAAPPGRRGRCTPPGAAASSRARCRAPGRRRARAAAATVRASPVAPAIPSRSLPFVPRRPTSSGERSSSSLSRSQVARLDGVERLRERLARRAQRPHVAAERRPGCEAVLARHDRPGAGLGERLVPARERRHGARAGVVAEASRPDARSRW